MSYDLDRSPKNFLRMAGPESLHRGFLGGEAAGEVYGWVASPRAVVNLSFREDTARETIAIAFED